MKMPRWLSGGCLNSYQKADERESVYRALKEKKISILLISPERLFLEDMNYSEIGMICIDEAHCVSEWSHNFRPSYLRLKMLLHDNKYLSKVPCLGLTATATINTQISVANILNISWNNIIRAQSMTRSNLRLTISLDKDKISALIPLLKSENYRNMKSIIVYCTYKWVTEKVSSYLNVSI